MLQRFFVRKARALKGRLAPVEALERRTLLSGNITQFHYDPGSTGQNLAETVLTPTDVNSADFGRQFITPLDGQVYAQPLAVQSINITRVGSNSSETTGVHNVLYVATMHDSVFAVDADTGVILWQDSFLQINSPQVTTSLSPVATAGVIPFPTGTVFGSENAAVNANDIAPEEGVFGTPVIDPKTNILYCISDTQERRNDTSNSATPSASGTNWHFVQRLWAINLRDGSVAITPTVPAGAPVPPSMGQTITDTAINSGSSVPAFSSFTNYEYYAGPYVKGSGDNGELTDPARNDIDGWVTNQQDLPANASHSVFAGTTPYAQGDLALNSTLQPTRTGMMILNGTIYIGMTSHGDQGPYYGWVLGYSATTLQNTSAFVTTPTWENYDIISGSAGTARTTYDSEGGIWGGEQSITTDGTYLYMTIGNGAFDWTSDNFPTNGSNTTTDNGHSVQIPIDGDYGNAIIKLAIDPNANQGGLDLTKALPTTFNPDGSSPGTNGQNLNGYGLKVADFFEPSNMVYLNYKDQDIGSGGVLLLPNSITSTVTGDPMMVAGGKEGRVYLLDRNNMGGFDTAYFSDRTTDTSAAYNNGTAVFASPGNGIPTIGPDPISYDRVLGEYESLGAIFTVPSYYMNGNVPTLVIDGNGAGLRAFNLTTFQYPAQAAPNQTTPKLPASVSNPTPLGTTSNTFSNHGSTSSISANGTSGAVVWNVNPQKSTTKDDLLAYNIGMGTLYDSGNTGVLTNNIANDTAMKFSVPSIFNGMVYINLGAGWGVPTTSGGAQTAFAQGAIVGFGLQSSYLNTGGQSYFAAPTALSGRYIASTGVQLGWTRNSSLETETEIDRSPNGSVWSVLAYVSNGASAYTDTTASANQTYFYRVRAISGSNATATATSSGVITTPPTLSSALSRKTHSSAGTFDVPLPLTGSPGVEDRIAGPTLVVFTFAAPVSEGSGFGVTLSSGAVASTSASGSTLSVNLSGASDGQTLVLTLADVRDVSDGASGTYTLQAGVLLGDTNGDGTVNSADITAVKLASGQAVSSGNFRDDLDASGAINSVDITSVKLHSGDSLPAAPAAPAAVSSSFVLTPGVSNPVSVVSNVPAPPPDSQAKVTPVAAKPTPVKHKPVKHKPVKHKHVVLTVVKKNSVSSIASITTSKSKGTI